MTHPSDHDRLVDWLRQQRPAAPPPAADLEDQIMAAIDLEAAKRQAAWRDRAPWSRPWAGLAIAASVVLSLGGWGVQRTLFYREAQLAEVNEFLTQTWYDSAYGDDTIRLALNTTEPDWLFSVYATPY